MRIGTFFSFPALGFGRLVRLPSYRLWLFASA